MAAKCPKCQSENPETATFCADCGTRLSLPEEPSFSVTKTLISPAAKGSLLAGKYRIIEPIGKGGMGVVYKAEDIKLERTVALKFLPAELTEDPEARERFVREAKAAAALSHPHICTVYEIGEDKNQYFIAMECIGGQSLKDKMLKGPLDQAGAIDIGIQVAEGLEEAHKKGIVHRDIKPGNIMVTEKGQAKVMDFGLAKVFGASLITKEAKTMGTVAYMSPEQAQGKSVDHRTDIWSLGVVLYEMLTGQLPFKGEYEQSVMYAIMNKEAEPLTRVRADIPKKLENVVLTSLAKNPADRYQSMDELLEDLKAIAEGFKPVRARAGLFRGRILGLKKVYAYPAMACLVIFIALAGLLLFPKRSHAYDSIAVLPLQNISGDPGQDYFSEGVHGQLITELSKIKSIKVIAQTSVMGYKGTKKRISEIARELPVAAVVEGSTMRSGNMVRISIRLIDGRNDENLWADSFDREYSNILALQSEVAMAIARNIQASLTPEETKLLKRERTVNPEAHELYLKGLYHYKKWTKDGFEKSIGYLEKAIEIDPTHAEAMLILADAHGALSFSGYLGLGEAHEIGEPLVKRALEIDETIAEAHRQLGHIWFYFYRDWMNAEREYLRAIELNPGYSAAHFSFSWYLITQGRFEEALIEAKRGQELDPLSIAANMTVGDVYLYSRKYDQALEQFQQITDLEPNSPLAFGYLTRIYEQMGMYTEAVGACQKEWTLEGVLPEEVAGLVHAYDQHGPQGYWMWRLQKLEDRSAPYTTSAPNTAYTAARFHAHLGNKNEAIALLEKAYQDQNIEMVYLNVQADWDTLRDDPRFKKLLRLMNFSEN